jgi:ABC-type nitrate/sulfonate/bicarbonate transport system permease component
MAPWQSRRTRSLVFAGPVPGQASLRKVASHGRWWRRSWPASLIALRSIIGFLIVWQFASLLAGNPILLPPPLQVLSNFGTLIVSGEVFQQQASVSIGRLLISLVIAMVLAVPLGFLMGTNRRAAAVIVPVVEILRPISGIAWILLALFIFGIGCALPVFIMSYAAFFPMLLNTIAGVRGVDRRLISAATTMGVSRTRVFLYVVAPGALPTLIVGLRLAVAACWTAIVAAELDGSDSGLGFAIEWYRELLMTPKVLAFIAVFGLAGYLTDLLIRALQRRMTPWAKAASVA